MEGRCTEKLNVDDQFASCSSKNDFVACVNQSQCQWKIEDDKLNFSCFCSFTDCKCGDPAKDYYGTKAYL